MKSKITKIQILKNVVVILLAMMFMITPIVSVATNTIENTVTNNAMANNTTVENNAVGGNTDEETGGELEEPTEPKEPTLAELEVKYGKVGAQAYLINKELEAGKKEITVQDEYQLRAIAQLVNEDGITFEGIIIRVISKDVNGIVINCDEQPWTPIGTEKTHFQGTFMGGVGDDVNTLKEVNNTSGTLIKGLVMNRYTIAIPEERSYAGLFRYIGDKGAVYNIITEEFGIDLEATGVADVDAKPADQIAGAVWSYAGNIAAINHGLIQNCVNKSSIAGGSYVGGIVGLNEGTIQYCTNNEVVGGYDIVGGIAGCNRGRIEYCLNLSDVNGSEMDIGGIAGKFEPNNNDDCIMFAHNLANVKGNALSHDDNKECVSGIVGGFYADASQYSDAKIKYCMYEGYTNYKTDEQHCIYGILGNMSETTGYRVENCIAIIDTVNSSTIGLDYADHLNTDYKWLKVDYKVWGYVVERTIGESSWKLGLDAKHIKDIEYDGVQVYVRRDDGKLIYNTSIQIGAKLEAEYDIPENPGQNDDPSELGSSDPEIEGSINISDLFPKTPDDKDASKTSVKFTVTKNEDTKAITGTEYFKENDTIIITAKFNKILRNGLTSDSELIVPKLSIVKSVDGEIIEMEEVSKKANAESGITEVTYKYVVKDGDNFEVKELKLSGCNGIIAQGKKDNAVGIDGEKICSIEPAHLVIDTKPAEYSIKAYVEDKLETGRYGAGTEIIFEVSINEKVSIEGTKPKVEVSFSESGEGKYNYSLEEQRAGTAKYKGVKDSETGTVWVFSYIIQEGDEGDLCCAVAGGSIVDLAGNISEILKEEIKADVNVTGTTWNADDIIESITLKKNDEEIKEDVTISQSDKLTVEVVFNKVLYNNIGSTNNSAENNKLTNEYAPNLYLNGKSSLIQTSKNVSVADGKTTITYTYDFNELDGKIVVRELSLINNANTSVKIEDKAEVEGVTPYSDVYNETYKTDDADLYNLIDKDAKKVEKLEYTVTIEPSDSDSDDSSDADDSSTSGGKIEILGQIYADTTSPVVEISTKNGTDFTNEDEIEFIFEFSEEVVEFTQEDITVNGGTIVDGSFVIESEGFRYSVKVNPIITSGNTSELQVIVEKGACKDLVGRENVRREKIITIDKLNPTLVSYSMREEEGNIIVDFIFDERISEIKQFIPTLKIGDKDAIGKVNDPEIDALDSRKVTFKYEKSLAEGGKVDFSFEIEVLDMVGNTSGLLKVKPEEEIILTQSQIIPDSDGVYYTFKKGEQELNIENPTYFKAGEVLTIVKHTIQEIEGEKKEETQEYSYTIDEYIAKYLQDSTEPIQMKYMLLNGESAELVVKDGESYQKLVLSRNTQGKIVVNTVTVSGKIIDISDANMYMDAIAPTLEITGGAEEKNEFSRYTIGKEIIITATSSEVISENTEVPEIKVSFTTSGVGRYNYQEDATKGNAKLIETKVNENGTTTWKYKYVVEHGDEGYLVLDCVGGKIIDLAGNEYGITSSTETPDIITGNNWPEEVGIEAKLYKNDKNTQITSNTSFKKGEKLIIELEVDKFLYNCVGEINKSDKTELLANVYAPSLYLNGNKDLRVAVAYSEDKIFNSASYTAHANSNEAEVKTIITYEYTFKEEDEATAINKLVLVNDFNSSARLNGIVDGRTPYSTKNSKLEESEKLTVEEYGLIERNAIKTIPLSNNIALEQIDFYADTTLPTVEIKTQKDPTNADIVKFTFEFSEKVEGFEPKDITIAKGGNRLDDTFKAEIPGLKYSIDVKTSAEIGTEEELQVIVEKGACKDLVGQESVRQEKTIKIDKLKPILESCIVRQEGENGEEVVVEFTLNEAIGSAEGRIEMSIGGKKPAASMPDVLHRVPEDPNKLIYRYTKAPADGGKVEISLDELELLDKAGNSTGILEIIPEGEIIFNQTVIPGTSSNENEKVYYTFEKNGEGINNFAEPRYFKAGDTIVVNKIVETSKEVDGNIVIDTKTTKYQYTINEDIAKILQNSSKPTKINIMVLIDSKENGKPGTIDFEEVTGITGVTVIRTGDANIYFDVVAPSVSLEVEVENKNEENVYAEGKELIITATTNEAIKDSTNPEIKVSFTNSGIGKYNYQEDTTKGNAVLVDTITSEDGTITWKYKYVVQKGDDGEIVIEYATEKEISDFAGNTTVLKTLPKANKGEINLDKVAIKEKDTNVTFEIYKNTEKITDFTNNTYFAKGDTIKVVANFNKSLYSIYDDDDRERIKDDEAPTLTIDGKVFEAEVVHDKNEYKTIITYSYTVTADDAEELLDTLTLETQKDLIAVSKEIPEGTEEGTTATPVIKTETISGSMVSGENNIKNCNLHIYNTTTFINGEVINIDTVQPKVSITPKYPVTIKDEKTGEEKTVYNAISGPVNLDTIIYTIEFSENVKDFDLGDITINGGVVATTEDGAAKFAPVEENRKYTLEVIPSVAMGNEGNVQVIVEQDSCTDKVGLGNVRAESVIKVDKKAPTLMVLEAYAPTDSNIRLNEEIDSVKEYYGTGDTLTVVATFDENVTTEAKLVLYFGDKVAKGTVNQVATEGSKITYTYKIQDGDKGILSAKSFRGTAVDAAGNEAQVTTRPLSGDTIIADTIAPKLNELKVVSPDEGAYKESNTITIEAIYDEEIYVLENNEVKLINTQIEVVDTKGTEEKEDDETSYTNNAPTLKIKFGNGEVKEAIVSGYGKKEDGSEDRTKLVYTYTIVGEKVETTEAEGETKEVVIPGDNGNLSIVSYTNKDNVEVCDIAGNVATLNVKQTGSKIAADTTRPEVTNITAEVINPTIENTGIYHKAGNKVKITVEFNEEVSSAVIMPEILVGFSEVEGVEPTSYNTYSYESDWNVNSTTVEYTYTINEGDNGYLWVKVPEAQFKDEAGNTNVEEAATKCEDVFADTTAPTITMMRDEKAEQDGQTIIIKAEFSEDVYDLSENTRIALEKENAPKVVYSIGNNKMKEVNASTINGAIIEYTITKQKGENGILKYSSPMGNLYDRAGNEYYVETTDTTAPVLESVVISSNSGTYAPYCKEGTEIYVVATFNEEIQTHNMKLKAKLGEEELEELSGVVTEENRKQIKFTYTVKPGDMGEFTIIDICGATDNETTEEDKTYGWVKDSYDNQNDIYSLEEAGVTPTGKAIADTKDPYVANIEAIIDGKVVATYAKKDGEVAIVKETRTTKTDIEYVITYSEPIRIIDESKIKDNLNGEIKITVDDEYEYYDKIVVTLSNIDKVDNASHLITILGEAVEDRAGNNNSKEEFKLVTIDAVKPEVIFTNNDDIKVFVIPTSGTLTIVQGVEFSEDISKIEYKWDNDEYVDITESYVDTQTNRVVIPEKEFTSAGTHKLYVKATDIAGNDKEVWKEYSIKESKITITPSVTEMTNKDVYVTVNFGEGLTENKIVTFKAEGSNEYVEKTPNADGTYTITENGHVHAKASDKAGHEVFVERTITNIDKIAPEVELTLNGADLVIGTGKEKATVKTTVNISEPVIVEYYWSCDEETSGWVDAPLVSEENITSLELNTASQSGACYLYVKVTDEAGNETKLKSNAFRVFETNDREKVTITEGEDGEKVETKETIPAEIKVEKLIDFNQEGKYISISYNNFNEGEEYLDIIKEKEISLTEEIDGDIDAEGNFVNVNKPTIITVKGYDACGNTVTNTFEVTRESIEGPEFNVWGNPEYWTNQDIVLEVYAYEELSALTVNGESILSEDKFGGVKVVTENGEYKFIATDMYGITSEKVIKVTKIDKVNPVISKVETSGKVITITATDIVNEVEGSGIAEYAITDTTELPVEWSESKVIKVTNDGAFFVWVKDIAGNVFRTEQATIVDTTAPTIRFDNTLTTVEAGMPIEVNVATDEKAKISYSWDEKEWVDSEEFITSVRVDTKYDKTGKYTLYVKAIDESGNESKSSIEFTVTKPATVLDPQVVFEGLYTTQIDGVNYVKVSNNMTTEEVTSKMKQSELCGVTPEYTKLADGNKLKTGSEITLNGDTKYIIVVNGDVNCDGNIDFLGDIISANDYRIGIGTLSIIQKLAADINNDGKVDFISDILAINDYRIGITKSL